MAAETTPPSAPSVDSTAQTDEQVAAKGDVTPPAPSGDASTPDASETPPFEAGATQQDGGVDSHAEAATLPEALPAETTLPLVKLGNPCSFSAQCDQYNGTTVICCDTAYETPVCSYRGQCLTYPDPTGVLRLITHEVCRTDADCSQALDGHSCSGTATHFGGASVSFCL